MSERQVHVKAWNTVDRRGRPVILVDEIMSTDKYKTEVAGRYAMTSAALVTFISRAEVDAALDRSWLMRGNA